MKFIILTALFLASCTTPATRISDDRIFENFDVYNQGYEDGLSEANCEINPDCLDNLFKGVGE